MSDDDLVPEGFSWDEARKSWSTTPRERRKRCPNCERISGVTPVIKSEGYRCNNCNHTFKHPVVDE